VNLNAFNEYDQDFQPGISLNAKTLKTKLIESNGMLLTEIIINSKESFSRETTSSINARLIYIAENKQETYLNEAKTIQIKFTAPTLVLEEFTFAMLNSSLSSGNSGNSGSSKLPTTKAKNFNLYFLNIDNPNEIINNDAVTFIKKYFSSSIDGYIIDDVVENLELKKDGDQLVLNSGLSTNSQISNESLSSYINNKPYISFKVYFNNENAIQNQVNY